MPTTRLAATLLALALAAPSLARAKGRTQPGLWEVSVEVELPGGGGEPTTQRECLSQADVDGDPLPTIDRGACKATGVRRVGDRVTWKVDCGVLGQGGGELHYVSATVWEGSLSLSAAGLPVRASFKARRLGDCRAP